MVHCVVLTFPAQGHINPMHQFSKLLQQKGVKVTLVTTLSYCKKLQNLPASIALETISDGFDNDGINEADNYKAYLERFWQVGPKTFAEVLEKLGGSGDPVDCVIYNSFFPWALEVAKRFGIVGAVFLTQNMCVNSIYYHVNQGNLCLPLTENEISLPLLPKLQLEDMPTFFLPTDEHSVLLDLVVGQFSNIDKADWILCNSFYEMEKEVTDWTKKSWPKFRTIGPCITSMILNKRGDEDQDVTQFKSEECMKWLDDKPKESVVGSYFLWIVRASEQSKLPKDFEKKSEKGLVIEWCSQLKVLAHEAIGCFVTHCGWNSTLEALSFGVPTVAMPYWSDQSTNAKLIEDVWKMGIRVTFDEKKIVRGEALKYCIMEIMKSDRGKEIKNNMKQWKALAAQAVSEEGSSHENIEEFVNSLFSL
uniref:Glycosyltransferase n=1 Tax=Cajanus cajan TaxID=3821 RepID=A0A151TAP9_CAJCA|nr:putative UDP-glucosyltransferase At1g05670 family [Cajanus cajan]